MNISKERIELLGCVLGIDASKYQKSINWAKAKAFGVEFAFIKITEGTTAHEDDAYNVKNRILEAQKQGVKVGYYHFARPGNISDAEKDANDEVYNVISHLGFLPVADLPLVLDLEAFSTDLVWDSKIDDMNLYVETFIKGMLAQGVNTIIYSYKSFIDINAKPIFGSHPLWIAAYPNNPETTLPKIPNGWTKWDIWQFTDKGRIDGYDGDIDLNIMKKEYFNLF